jgi:uncharacterized protein YuzE
MKHTGILIEISGPRRPLEVTVDEAHKCAYVRVRFGTVWQTIEHAPGVYLDVDAEGRLLGIELLFPTSAKGIQDAAEYYLQHEADADAEVPAAISKAGKILEAVTAA